MAEIDGRHVVCYTDHLPIVGAFQNPAALNHDSIAKAHLVEISQWTQDVRYLQGKSNVVADALSRPAPSLLGSANAQPVNMTSDEPSFDLTDETRPIAAIDVQTVDLQALAQAQAACPEVASHRQGKHPVGLIMSDTELQPGTLCSQERVSTT